MYNYYPKESGWPFWQTVIRCLLCYSCIQRHCQVFRQRRNSLTWPFMYQSQTHFLKICFIVLKSCQSTFMSIGWRRKHWMDHWGTARVTLRWHCLLWINSEIHYFWSENHFGYSSSGCKPHCLCYQSQKKFERKKWHSDAKETLFQLFFSWHWEFFIFHWSYPRSY